MKDLVKSNEVEKSEQNYIYSAKDIWELSNSSSRTWDNFVADIRNAISQKSNSSCAIDCITKSGIDKIYDCYDR